jgi:hypothetical protein
MQRTMAEWLRWNAGSLHLAGRGIGCSIVHALMGVVFGALNPEGEHTGGTRSAHRTGCRQGATSCSVSTRSVREILDFADQHHVLIAIHKFECFLNAHCIGSHINARVSELLITMLVMEAAFGITGLVSAPILYEFLMRE